MKLVSSFFYSLKQGIKGVFSNKTMSFISIISVTAALVILGIVLAMVLNINQFIKTAEDEINEIRVAIDESMDEFQLDDLKIDIISTKGVKDVEYKTKEDSFEEMKDSWGEDGYLLDGLKNPLDDYFIVTINNPDDLKSIASKILTYEGAIDVKYHQDIIQNFLDISNTVKQFGGLFIGFLLFICLVLISNTIKSRVLSKRDEIRIIKYVGASNNFIIAPFIVEGFVIGVIGSFMALGLCLFMYDYLINNMDMLKVSIVGQSIMPLDNLVTYLCAVLLVTGIGVGVLGSIVSVKKYLNV